MRHPLVQGTITALTAIALTLILVAPVRADSPPGLIKDINPLGASNPSALTAVGNTLFFAANDGVHGTELWRSDGTSASTRIVKDINVGLGGSNPKELTNVAGKVYFVAGDGIHGRELWKSDGTSAGTKLVKDIRAGGASANLSALTRVGNNLYFYRLIDHKWFHTQDVWKSDGTSAGTIRVVHTDSLLGESVGLAGWLFFATDAGGLWRTNGTNTVQVLGIASGGEAAYNLTPVGGRLYFSVFDQLSDPTYSLWRTDGTRARTKQLAGLDSLAVLTRFGNRVVFVSGELFDQLWISDGTFAGTQQIYDIGPTENRWAVENDISMAVVLNRLYFTTASTDFVGRLWRTDGTPAGTEVITETFAGQLTSVAGVLCFVAGFPGQIWESDGSAAGTYRVSDFGDDSNPLSLTPIGNRLYFTADDGTHGAELWSYTP